LAPHPDWLCGPPNLLYSGYQGDLSPGVRQAGHKADYSPPFSVKVKRA